MPMQATTTAPLFSAALRPDRSARLAGGWVALVVATLFASPFALLVPGMLLPIAVALVAGVAALGFLGWQQGQRRRMRQHVTLWPDQLEVVTTHGKAGRQLRRFDPKKVRLVLQRDHNEKVVALRLRGDKDLFEIGAFMSPGDKSSFAKAFGTALKRARQPG